MWRFAPLITEEVSSVINHTRTLSKLSLSNYSPRDPRRLKPSSSRKLLNAREALAGAPACARGSLFRIARIEKLIDHHPIGDDRKISRHAPTIPRAPLYVRCRILKRQPGLGSNCQFDDHFGFKSVIFGAQRQRINFWRPSKTASNQYNCVAIIVSHQFCHRIEKDCLAIN